MSKRFAPENMDEGLIEPEDSVVPTTEWKPANPIDKITDTQYDALLRLAAVGMSHEQMASWIHVPLDTFENWYYKSNEFRRAIDNAKVNAVTRVADVCYYKAMKGDIAAIKLFLQHVGRWQVSDYYLKNEGTINVQVNNLLDKVPVDDVVKLLRAQKKDNGAEG